jgi:hypothetical protein
MTIFGQGPLQRLGLWPHPDVVLKRELFDRLSTHLGVLADQVEEAMLHGDLKRGT